MCFPASRQVFGECCISLLVGFVSLIRNGSEPYSSCMKFSPFEVSGFSVTDSEDTGLDISCSFSSKTSLEFLGYSVWLGRLQRHQQKQATKTGSNFASKLNLTMYTLRRGHFNSGRPTYNFYFLLVVLLRPK